MPSWTNPTNTNPNHVEVLKDLADKDEYTLTMGQSATVYTDQPTGAMKADNNQKLFRRREGGVDEPFVISLAGGGTGAQDAAGARTVLQVNKSGTGSSEARTNSQNDLRYVQQTVHVDTTSPLSGGGDLSTNRTISIQNSTTSQKGAVQLNDTLSSTSTSQALTAAQGKVLKDAVDANASAIPYYNSDTISASGLLTSGSCKVVRIGDMVTIHGVYNHSSTNLAASSTGVIPLWARPSSTALNLYTATDTGAAFSARCYLESNGTIGFRYSSNSTTTLGFTISYTV